MRKVNSRQRKHHYQKILFKYQNGECTYCETSIYLPPPSIITKSENNLATLDHIIPRSKGGKSTWDNLTLCCSNCNNKKGSNIDKKEFQTLKYPPLKYNGMNLVDINGNIIPNLTKEII